MQPSIHIEPFGHTSSGDAVIRYTLRNSHGMEASILNWGGTVQRLTAPDRHGRWANVSLCLGDIESYEKDSPFFGSLVGRYGNRIANAAFKLDGKEYKLSANSSAGGKPCCLHGGDDGYNQRIWMCTPVLEDGRVGLRLELESYSGDGGFPGNLTVTVFYWLTDENALEIDYRAETDAPTHVALTNHTYFNLRGEGAETVLDQLLYIKASHYTPVGKDMIPTGEIAPVQDTPFDFRVPTEIGASIDEAHPQLRHGGGYDHNFVFDREGRGLEALASVFDPVSGRYMEVLTEEPGVQLYTANGLDGSLQGESGRAYQKRSAFCLETQHYPDTPNKPAFPSTLLQPGQVYKTRTVYRFSAR